MHSCEAVTCLPGSLLFIYCHYQNQEEKGPWKESARYKGKLLQGTSFWISAYFSMCFRRTLPVEMSVMRVTELNRLVVGRVWRAWGVAKASCVALSTVCSLFSTRGDYTPPRKESHGCAGQRLAHPPGPVSAMNPLGFCRGQCQQLGSLLRSRLGLFFALNFNYRRNVSLDCQWFLISDERLHMSP